MSTDEAVLMSTHNIPFFNMKKKITINSLKPAAIEFFQVTKERVRNSQGKRTIRVRAIDVLLYNNHQSKRKAMIGILYNQFPLLTLKTKRVRSIHTN